MTPLSTIERDRLRDLLADEVLGQLSGEARIELAALRARPGVPGAPGAHAADVLHALSRGGEAVSDSVRARLTADAEQVMEARQSAPNMPIRARRSAWMPALLAACVALAGTLGVVAWRWTADSKRDVARAQAAEREAETIRRANAELLATATARATALAQQVAQAESRATELDRRLAEAAAREVALARELTTATERLDAATLKIARFEAPVDPAEIAQQRRKLLEVPGTMRIAWAPFDLPDAPAEQGNIQGDVVWNDESKQGYLRFVGLKVNDPKVEQYQVWVIDERGMEQKVSGGVFNAGVDGEVIVPIDPAIDVRRVALFAVTIEEPGGTWVPSLKRRVVVAPRPG